MAEIGKKLALLVVSGLIARGIAYVIVNEMDGKDALGRKKKPKQETYQDWKGNVILGKGDYQVV